MLAKVGGFEFGCLTGVILGAAAHQAMTIIDGFNTTASAFIAKALSPQVSDYLMASHLSLEQAHKKSLAALGLSEYIDLDFRLGESIGAGIQKKCWIWRSPSIGNVSPKKKRGWKHERDPETESGDHGGLPALCG